MDYLQHLLNKVNRVTANHRHGNPVTKKDLDALANAQIEYNESRLAENLVIASEQPKGDLANGAVAEEHIKCALKNLGNISDRKAERWSIVGALFGLGLGSSTKLCEAHGVDPFEIIGKDKCEKCELYE